jgi:importin-7
MKPLFEFVMTPEQIEFEDDIILVLKSFIKKTQSVSPTLWTIFPHLTKVFAKNKLVFGNLLDTLNYYLIFGRDYLAQTPDNLNLLIEIAKQSLFCQQPNITVQNSEGAILLQLIFQVFAG